VVLSGTAAAGASGVNGSVNSPSSAAQGSNASVNTTFDLVGINTSTSTTGGIITVGFDNLNVTSSTDLCSGSSTSLAVNSVAYSNRTASSETGTVTFNTDGTSSVDSDIALDLTFSNVDVSNDVSYSGTQSITVESVNADATGGADGMTVTLGPISIGTGNRASASDGTGTFDTDNGEGYLFDRATVF